MLAIWKICFWFGKRSSKKKQNEPEEKEAKDESITY
jgi:hypothetical protein